MADTLTKNYHLVKPEISGSPTTWGVKLNADLDVLDSQLFTISGSAAIGGSVIGEIKMYAGSTAPTNYKLCDGTVYQNSDIPALATILNNAYGGVPGVSNAVPNFCGAFPIGAGPLPDGSGSVALAETGGEVEHIVTEGEMPAHGHPIVIIDPGHFHHLSAWTSGADYPAGQQSFNVFSSVTQTGVSRTGITADTVDNGGDQPHNNMPPFLGINFIIKYQ